MPYLPRGHDCDVDIIADLVVKRGEEPRLLMPYTSWRYKSATWLKPDVKFIHLQCNVFQQRDFMQCAASNVELLSSGLSVSGCKRCRSPVSVRLCNGPCMQLCLPFESYHSHFLVYSLTLHYRADCVMR